MSVGESAASGIPSGEPQFGWGSAGAAGDESQPSAGSVRVERGGTPRLDPGTALLAQIDQAAQGPPPDGYWQLVQYEFHGLSDSDRARLAAALASLQSDAARACVYDLLLKRNDARMTGDALAEVRDQFLLHFASVESLLRLASVVGTMSEGELRDYADLKVGRSPSPTPKAKALDVAWDVAYNLRLGLDEVPFEPGASYAQVEAQAIAPYVAKAIARGLLPLPLVTTPTPAVRPGVVLPEKRIVLEGTPVVPVGVDVPVEASREQVDLGVQWDPEDAATDARHAEYVRVRDGDGERWYRLQDVMAAVEGAEHPGTPAELYWHAREIGARLRWMDVRGQMPAPMTRPPAGPDQVGPMSAPTASGVEATPPTGGPWHMQIPCALLGESPYLYVINGAEYVRLAPRTLHPDDRWYPAAAFWQPP